MVKEELIINRDSNMDLMRITAMLLVMLFHINFFNIALEEAPHYAYTGMEIFSYSLMKCFSMVCVNMFILVSGWYGIHPRREKFIRLVFQIWFFSILTYLFIAIFFDDVEFSVNTLLHLFFFGGYWFIPAYLLLYICSPVLNLFTEKVNKRTFAYVLVSYFAFQFVFGWLQQETYFDQGCSPLVFFGMYLLARYIRLHKYWIDSIRISRAIICYLAILLSTSAICTFVLRHFGMKWAEILMQYSSPLNCILSVLLLIIFSKIKLQSRVINAIGFSCFAAYLLHGSTFFYDKIYYPLGCYAFHVQSYIGKIFLTIALILVIFAVAIIIDFARIALWNSVFKTYKKKWPYKR